MDIPALVIFAVELTDRLPTKDIGNPQHIGEHIRKRRLGLSLKQSGLANLLCVCKDTIAGWENGRSFPQIRHYPKLIQFFGYNPFPVNESTISGRIRKFRIVEGLSQSEIAAQLGVDETTVRSWEKDRHIPSPNKMESLNRLMNKELSK
jgi:DNA-binding transcriptional regulator YiaG